MSHPPLQKALCTSQRSTCDSENPSEISFWTKKGSCRVNDVFELLNRFIGFLRIHKHMKAQKSSEKNTLQMPPESPALAASWRPPQTYPSPSSAQLLVLEKFMTTSTLTHGRQKRKPPQLSWRATQQCVSKIKIHVKFIYSPSTSYPSDKLLKHARTDVQGCLHTLFAAEKTPQTILMSITGSLAE